MSETEYDCPVCRERALIDAILIDALRSAIGVRQQTDIDEEEIDSAARRVRSERCDELCEKLTPAIIDALAPSAPKCRKASRSASA